MTFYLTPNIRPYDAGVLMTGQNFLEIPPGQNAYSTDGSCLGSCNQHLMEGPVYIMEAFNHMHYLGEQYCPAHFYTQALALWGSNEYQESVLKNKNYIM